ncbi:MAG: iron chelate uptake ABC transporter family permease subunit [Acidobacteria bacterium]|nr:iron chelate uptake ABC transporter family permease subunit [Acidobacteriota bacterium]
MAIEKVTPGRAARVLLLAALATGAVALLTPLFGSSTLSLAKAFRGEWPEAQMFFGVRLPRTLLSLLAGGALSVAGVLFQALLRDPLATPYTLGVSSGASLGAVVAICLGLHNLAGLPALWVAALAGAGVVLALVLAAAAEGRRMSACTATSIRWTARRWPGWPR